MGLVEICVSCFAIISLVHYSSAIFYKTDYLTESHCQNGSLILYVNSDSTWSGDIAGVIKMLHKPSNRNKKCNFTLSVSDSSSYGRNIALYYNVRELHLQYNENINIYENSSTNSLNLVKKMTKRSVSYSLRSFDQLLTRFSQKPSLQFKFDLNDDIYSASPYLQLDWTLVLEYRPYYSSFSVCPALDYGYVENALRCEFTDSDRVSCPYSYSAINSNNPVTSKNHFYPNSYQCATYDYLSDGAIAGISIAVTFTAAAFVFVIVRACRGPRVRLIYNRNALPNGGGAFVTVTGSAPTVVGINNNNYGYHVQGNMPMPMPPPAYGEVYPQPVIKK